MLSVQSPKAVPVTEPAHSSIVQQTPEETEIIIQSIIEGHVHFLQLPNWEPTSKALEIYLRLYKILGHDDLSAEQEIKIPTDTRITSIQPDLYRIFGTLQCNFEEEYAKRIIAAPTKEEGMFCNQRRLPLLISSASTEYLPWRVYIRLLGSHGDRTRWLQFSTASPPK